MGGEGKEKNRDKEKGRQGGRGGKGKKGEYKGWEKIEEGGGVSGRKGERERN